MATKSAADHGRPDTLTIRTPDDFHPHFRDEPVLADTVQACSAQFRRAIAMPNLVPPVTTVEAAAAYRERILGAAASRGVAAGAFEPLMTLYLTDSTTPEQIKAAHASGIVKAVKLYPAGATTNSASGVTDYAKVAAPLAAMGQYGLPLCVHGEVTDPSVDVFDRESNFISERLPSLLAANPGLRVIVEHMTTKEAVDFVLKSGPNVGGTITPQHLLVSRNAMLVGGAPRDSAQAFGAILGRTQSSDAPPPPPPPNRDQAAPVLPADSEARGGPAGALGRHPHGVRPPLPRHRLGAARRRAQGERVRLRRRVFGALRARAVRRARFGRAILAQFVCAKSLDAPMHLPQVRRGVRGGGVP